MLLRRLLLLLALSLAVPARAGIAEIYASCTDALTRFSDAATAKVLLMSVSSRQRLNLKLGTRPIEDLIIGNRLDLSHLYLTDDDMNYLLVFLRQQDTARVTHLNVSFNPALTRLSTDSFIRLFPNVTHLDLEGVPATSHKLHFIAEHMPNLQSLSLSMVDGEDLYTLQLMKKLTFLDLSSANIRPSRRTTHPNDKIEMPSVSLSALNDVLRYHKNTIHMIVLPPISFASDEGIYRMAERAKVRLYSPKPVYKVRFAKAAYMTSQYGLRIFVNEEPQQLYFPALMLPHRSLRSPSQTRLASRLAEFVSALSREGVEGYVVGGFEFDKGLLYGDIMFKRVVNGELKLFSLRKVFEYLQFTSPLESTWKTHLANERPNFTENLKRHETLQAAGVFDKVGALK